MAAHASLLLVLVLVLASACAEDAVPRRSVARDAGRDAGLATDAGSADSGEPADASSDAREDATVPSSDAGDAGNQVVDGETSEDFAQQVAEVVCESGCPEVVITCETTDAGQSCQALLRPWEDGECEASYSAQLPTLLELCDSPAFRDALSACAEQQRDHACFTQAEADQAAMDAEMGISGSLQQSFGADCEALDTMTRACLGA